MNRNFQRNSYQSRPSERLTNHKALHFTIQVQNHHVCLLVTGMCTNTKCLHSHAHQCQYVAVLSKEFAVSKLCADNTYIQFVWKLCVVVAKLCMWP